MNINATTQRALALAAGPVGWGAQFVLHAANLVRPPLKSDLPPSGRRHLEVRETSQGYTITLVGKRDHKTYQFEGVQDGDVIVRTFDVSSDNWGTKRERLQLRVLQRVVEAGNRKGLGHILVFAGAKDGKGIVINVGPDEPNGIRYRDLDDHLGALEPDQFHILRMSNDPKKRAGALRFLRYHLWLADQGLMAFGKETISLPLRPPRPVTFEGQTYDTYYHFTCVGAVIAAYGLQDRTAKLIEQNRAQLGSPAYRLARAALWTSRDNLFNLIQVIAPTGQTLLEMAEAEIKPTSRPTP